MEVNDSPLTYIEMLQLEKRVNEIESEKARNQDNLHHDVELEEIIARIEIGMKKNERLHLRSV